MATSVDPKCVFSFSGGTITKLQNQLLDDSARSTVMVGLWGQVNGLLPVEEFKRTLKEGWSQSRKQKAIIVSLDAPPMAVM